MDIKFVGGSLIRKEEAGYFHGLKMSSHGLLITYKKKSNSTTEKSAKLCLSDKVSITDKVELYIVCPWM